MNISPEQAQEVANLARLELSGQELQALTEQLNAIVAYMDQLNELDTSQVRGTSHVVSLACPRREDTPRPCEDPRAILARAPSVEPGPTEEEFFVVPKVIT